MVPYNPEGSFWERVQKDGHQRLLAVTILCSIIMFLYEGLMVCYRSLKIITNFDKESVISCKLAEVYTLLGKYLYFSSTRIVC